MKRLLAATVFYAASFVTIVAAPLQAAPQAPAPSVARPAGGDQGMVIRGDQEAPLVLYIVPWQEPKELMLPEAPQQSLLPVVLDRNRSLIDDPENRSLGGRDATKGK